jgi:hydrophobe/amphiphile efflux-1 (HAE1) family protein
MNITRLAINRRIATSVIAVALVVLGVFAMLQLPVNFLPDMTYPMIKVHIWWRGATPDEIITNLAEPIERQMATVDGLDSLESSSIEGMYTLLVNFKYDVDVNVAYQDALGAMARVARQLPRDIDPPLVFKADPSQLPVVQLTVRSDQWDLVQLRTWADNWLQDQLLATPGVAGTEVVGGLKREIRIHLDPLSLEKFGLPLTTLLARLQAENLEQFGGRITSGPREIIARTLGEYRSLDEIRALVLKQNGQAKITLADVAKVEDAHEEVRVITRLDGQAAVKLSVLKQADANSVEVARALDQRLEILKPALPPGVVLGVVENQADYIIPALKGVTNAALEAAVLVFLVVYLFLGSFRQVLVMLLALPATLAVNFALMKLAGFSLNIFSLGGLVVAIGVVLDNSIVVIENITRLRHADHQAGSADLSLRGTVEVGPAILAATLAFISLFVPFLLIPGLTSLLFKELILVIGTIVCLSLAVAITLTPMLSAALLAQGSAKHKISRFETFFSRITEGYGRLLGWILRGRWLVIAGFVALLVGGIWLAPQLGSEFLPRMDDGRLMIKVKLPTGAALAETDRLLDQLEALVADDPLVESAFTLVGGKVWGLYTFEVANEGQIDLQLVPRGQRNLSTDDYLRQLRAKVAKISVPGGKAMVMPAKIKGLRQIGTADIEIKLQGADLGQLFALAQRSVGTMNQLKQFSNVYLSLDMNKPEYQIRLDRVRAAELGVSVVELANATRTLLSGTVVTRYREGEDFYNLRVMIAEGRIGSRRDIENLIVFAGPQGAIRLGDVAQVELKSGPVEIVREDQIKTVIVRGDALGVSVGEALKALQGQLDATSLPPGYEITFGGQAQMMAEMHTTIIKIIGFALFFAFVVLAVQFNSFKLPALVLGSVPFCVAGMIYALYVTGIPTGATVLIGLLVVVAATVNEGVLLLTVVEELRRRPGSDLTSALIEGAKMRLRPRIMIAIAVIAGFIPLALNLEEGGDMLQPMAVAAIGGIAVGLFVALFLLPCLYLVLTRKVRDTNIPATES